MTPETIPFSSIVLADRIRKTYSGIEELADSIEAQGLIQPLVLEATTDSDLTTYRLVAGGRRHAALTSLGVTTLYHGVSSDPSRPGFLLADLSADVLRSLLIEISENHNREDLDWRDDLAAIVKAWYMWEREQHVNGEPALRRLFGDLVKVPYADVTNGLLIHEDVVANPDRYAECSSIFAAYQKFLKIKADAVAKIAAEKSFAKVPAFRADAQPTPPLILEPTADGERPPVVIPLSQSLLNTNGLDFMASLPPDSFDHIITDPDYAVDVDRLEAGVGDAAAGVVQDSISESLRDLERFLYEAFRVTRNFCVFWYDLDHHEKLQRMAVSVGWRVQRWPLTWHKIDHRSNGAPQHNFPKSTEWAMVLRKPSATLAQVQTSSCFSHPSGDTVRAFGHPFAKPDPVWRWLFNAVAVKGQTILDPFAGKGSCPVAAVGWGLRPVATEIQEVHFNDLVLNVAGAYRKVLGTNVQFA